jgi:hypothetical protein
VAQNGGAAAVKGPALHKIALDPLAVQFLAKPMKRF